VAVRLGQTARRRLCWIADRLGDIAINWLSYRIATSMPPRHLSCVQRLSLQFDRLPVGSLPVGVGVDPLNDGRP
jgi:hypothetical protein